MPKRKTVKPNLPRVRSEIKKVFRSNVVFCEAMGRPQQKTWVTEWGRDHNLPSPEEAAKMCILLQTTPEDILLEPEDIALVNDLLEQEKGAEKALGINAEGITAARKALLDAIDGLTNEQCEKMLLVVLSAKGML